MWWTILSVRSPFSWLRSNFGPANLFAGLAVGAFLIPQAMAYGQLAGVGVAVGLGVAVVPLLLYPLLGRHRWLSMGPESAVALMAAATAGPLAAAHGVSPVSTLALLAVATGLLLLVARMVRAAVVTDLLSKPVLTGYLTGVAILMVLSQLGNILGSPVDASTLLTLVQSLPTVSANFYSVAVCSGVVASVLLLRLWRPRFPGILLALLAAIPAGYFLPVATVGEISVALPSFGLPVLTSDFFLPLATGAAAIAIVAYTDVIATARAFADGSPVNAGRELTALGASQIAVGLFGGYPVSASSSRTAIARNMHARTRFYSYVVAAVALGAPLLLGPALGFIPKAALAGVVLVAALGLIDTVSWRELRRLRLGEVAVAVSCLLGVLVFGILPGILLAVAVSIAELLTRLARPHDAVLGVVPGLAGMHDVDDYPAAQTIEGLVVFRYDAPLFFANANNFYDACLEAADTPGCQWLLLNVESNVEVDATGLDALRELYGALASEGKVLALARVKNDLRGPLERYGLLDLIGEEFVFPTLPVAVASFVAWRDSDSTTRPQQLRVISPVHRFARVEHIRQDPPPK